MTFPSLPKPDLRKAKKQLPPPKKKKSGSTATKRPNPFAIARPKTRSSGG